MQPKVSIIIPTHNNEKTISVALDSALGQTLREIEVIVVDDACSDGTPGILSARAQTDPRLTIITHSECLSATVAKIDGTAVSTGEYVMYLDADDELERDACAVLYQEELLDPVDILHFDTRVNVLYDHVQGAAVADHVSKGLPPLRGEGLFDACYLRDEVGWTTWNKMYDGSLCRKVYSQLERERTPRGEDVYAFFALSFYARSYRRLRGKALITYNFGAGGGGRGEKMLTELTVICQVAPALDAIQRLIDRDGMPENCQRACDRQRCAHLAGAVDCFSRLSDDERASGLAILLEYWDVRELSSNISLRLLTDRNEVVARDVAMAGLQARLDAADRDVSVLRQEVAALRSSHSWKVGQALMWVPDRVRSLVRRI